MQLFFILTCVNFHSVTSCLAPKPSPGGQNDGHSSSSRHGAFAVQSDLNVSFNFCLHSLYAFIQMNFEKIVFFNLPFSLKTEIILNDLLSKFSACFVLQTSINILTLSPIYFGQSLKTKKDLEFSAYKILY